VTSHVTITTVISNIMRDNGYHKLVIYVIVTMLCKFMIG